LAHANLLQLVRHHGTDSVRDLGLLCRSKMLRPAEIMVVNITCSVFLMSVVSVTLDQFVLGSPRPSNNFFADRHRTAAQCLPIPGIKYTFFATWKLM